MSKILPITSLYKNIKNIFSKSAQQAESTVVEKTEQVAEETVKVTSKQIEAYYKRYDKSIKTPVPKVKQASPLKEKEQKAKEVNDIVQKECDAYNKIRYFDVSEDALKDLEHNFEEKRERVINIILKNPQNLPSAYIKAVKQIKKPEELALAVRSYVITANYELNQRYNDIIQQVIKKKKMSLKDQQKLFKEETKICDVYLELVKAVTEPSKDPRVIKIEEQIKSMYNMDFVHLDTLEEAKRILKTIKLARKNNIPLPKNIIISPYTMIQTSGLNIAHNMLDNSVIINKQIDLKEATEKAYQQLISPKSKQVAEILKAQDAKWCATDDEFQLYLHEFVHSKYPVELLFPVKVKPIPAKYQQTAQGVGINAVLSRSELVTELKTKSILRSLNKNEKELLSYFE